MDIKSTARHLQRLGQPFDVIIVKGGVERTTLKNYFPFDRANPNPEMEIKKVEDLLEETKKDWNPDSIIINEKERNGSCNKNTGNQTTVNLNGLEPMPQNNTMQQQSNVPAEFKDYLISELKEKNAKLEKKLDKFETENEELKKANFELEKENRYKDKEFELDKKGMEVERNNGLAGVMETVGSNPALATIAATAIGRLMGIDVPAMGSIEASESPSNAPESAEGGTLQQQVAANIKNWLETQPEEVVTEVFNLMNLLAADVSKISDCMNLLNAE